MPELRKQKTNQPSKIINHLSIIQIQYGNNKKN